MNPQHAVNYNNTNTNKKVIYRSFVTNNYPAVSSGGSFNQLINSGIVHPTGVLIVPFLGAVTGTNGGLGDSQWKSPFDTCPATTSPVSLTNLQVSVGGQNVLQSTLQYGYEHFLEQVNLAEQLTSSDLGISTGERFLWKPGLRPRHPMKLVFHFCHMSSVRGTSDGRGPVTHKRVPDREEPGKPRKDARRGFCHPLE